MDSPSSNSLRPRRFERDSGVTIILVALLAVVLLVIAAFAIDLGQLYSQRRQTQNGVDSAAMAGARALDQVRFDGADPVTIYDAISTSINDHREGQAGTLQCWLVDPTGTPLPPATDACTSASAMAAAYSAQPATRVAGVLVTASQTRGTFLSSVIKVKTTTATTTAAATIQRYLGGAGSPFVVCGVPSVNADAYPIMDANGQLLPNATSNVDIPLQDSQEHTCGAGSAFKGKNNSDTILVGVPCVGSGPPWSAPCEQAWGDNGNGYSENIRDTVAGAVPCPAKGPYNGCDLLVPVASQGCPDGGNCNGTKIALKVVGWVVMHITGDGKGNPKYLGSVLAKSDGIVTGGQGASDNVTGDSLRVIKLIQ